MLGVDVSKYKKDALDNLKSSPKAVQELVTYQLESLKKTHEKERKLKVARWETMSQTGKISQEGFEKNVKNLKEFQADEYKKQNRNYRHT